MRLPLDGCRVLDICDEQGLFCGMLLACLGADVIKVEAPGGDRARNMPPFAGNIPHPERSLYWSAYNLNKRSITLNLEASIGRDLWRRLVQKADFVLESFAPGYLEKLGLDYPSLSRISRGLIMASITPFGQKGPYSNYRSSDIVSMAMGGMMFLCGDPDRPPVRISFPQSYLLGSAYAAAATMIAHFSRLASGEGQHIDVSIQEAVNRCIIFEQMWWEIDGTIVRRVGPKTKRWHLLLTESWQCKDGEVCSRLLWGGRTGKRTKGLVEWAAEEGMAGNLLEVNWGNLDMSTFPQEDADKIEETLSQFILTKTRKELHGEAVKRGFLLAPVNSAKDIVEDEHLQARGHWVQVAHPEWGITVSYPDPFGMLSEGKRKEFRRAPLVGEDNVEIYQGELGLSQEEMADLKRQRII